MNIDYKNELNKEQYDAVTTLDGPVLIIAGAGTGKTRTIVYRASYIIESGCPSHKVLMLTFTNKAADEMKERVIELIGRDVAKDITACTFHSFCVKMLRIFGHEIGLNPSFNVISTSDDADIINMKKAEQPKAKYDIKGFPPSGKIVEIISSSINRMMDIDEVVKEERFSKYEEFLPQIKELKEMADQYKFENGMLDYDDLMVVFVNMLKGRPDIASKISDMYNYIMVDEYQDTNALQDQILITIRQKNKNLAVVGDDMQSLYGFRGANVQYIIDFPKRFPQSKVIRLVKNYRSNQEILDLSNFAASYATEGYKKDLVSDVHAGRKPVVCYVSSQYEEAEKVVELIESLHDKDGIAYEEICVLSRTSALTSSVEAVLTSHGHNFVKYGGKKFFELEYVKTALSFLRVTVNQNDEISWFRILKLCSGVGDYNARKLSAMCRELGVEYLIDKKHEKKVYGEHLHWVYEQLKKMKEMSLQEMIESTINFYKEIRAYNIAHANVNNESKRTEYQDNLDREVQNMQESFPPIVAHYKTAVEFLDDLMLDGTSATQNSEEEGSVVISTIHSVKGLEYQAVIIIDCVDGIFPSTNESNLGEAEDNEELRCFYVAVTRAKTKLFLISPLDAVIYGRNIICQLSHYLNGGSQYYQEDGSKRRQMSYGYNYGNNYNNWNRYGSGSSFSMRRV